METDILTARSHPIKRLPASFFLRARGLWRDFILRPAGPLFRAGAASLRSPGRRLRWRPHRTHLHSGDVGLLPPGGAQSPATGALFFRWLFFWRLRGL